MVYIIIFHCVTVQIERKRFDKAKEIGGKTNQRSREMKMFYFPSKVDNTSTLKQTIHIRHDDRCKFIQ